jgi:hypothetical protein
MHYPPKTHKHIGISDLPEHSADMVAVFCVGILSQ